MPLPLILGIGAAIAGVTGIGTGIHGVVKIKKANDTMKAAKSRNERNISHLEQENKLTSKSMDKLGKLELEILHSFSTFSDVFEQIKNKPSFNKYSSNGIILPKYDGEKLKEVSVGAGVLLGGLGGAALGSAGGFAAAGATTAAVMALGTASTGVPIASLSGIAATNATLAALGGGSIAVGGGGMALGTTILGATTLGVGLLVGGVIFNFTGGKLSDKADEAWYQMKLAEAKINKICTYLIELRKVSNEYQNTLSAVNKIYVSYLARLKHIVFNLEHKDWDRFTYEEKTVTENTVLLVGLLYNMCKVKLVLKNNNKNDINTINKRAVIKSINDAKVVLSDKFETEV